MFRAALRFRLDAGDSVLSNHLDTMAKNSSYTSWQSQNEIIDACNTVILNEIASSVNDAIFFSILVDDTTDMSLIEQFSLSVRYLNNSNRIVERFLQFIDVSKDQTAQGIADIYCNNLLQS